MEINRKAQQILLVAPSWVGDLVMSHGLIQVLTESGAAVDVLAPAWNGAILKRLPGVRRGIEMPVGHGVLKLGVRYALGQQLRETGYDQAILLTNTFKSALVPFFAKIPLRTGWRGECRWGLLNDLRGLDKQAYPRMVMRYMALGFPKGTPPEALPCPFPRLEVRPEVVQATLKRYGLGTALPLLALCPGAAFGPAKRWPEAYYAVLANTYLDRGWQVWLFGSPQDKPVLDVLQRLTQSRCINLGGRLSLDETVDLLSQAHWVISNDSGLLHVAAALDRPVLGLYGSTTPLFTPPLGKKAAVLEVTGLDCRPCMQPTCAWSHYRCLKEITPARVLSTMDRAEKEHKG